MKIERSPAENRRGFKFSRRAVLKLGGAFLVGANLPGFVAHAFADTEMVGDPNNPAALPAAINDAYRRGVRDISIRPGTYLLPATGHNSIELIRWQDAIIRFNGSTLIFAETRNRPVMLNECRNVTLEDATLQFAEISYTQGKVKSIGEDVHGKYLDWQIDAGYPTDIDPAKTTYNVVDQHTRLLKVGTGDYNAGQSMDQGGGLYRLRQTHALQEVVAIGDWLVCRAPGGASIVQLDGSQNCTLRHITLKNAGFAAFFETGGEGGHHYFACRVTHGPRPDEASEDQLVSCGADGFHSVGTRTGPTIERCIWDGVLLDDCIAIHGSLETVLSCDGDKIILKGDNHAGFAVNEPVRISSGKGFFTQVRCLALRRLPGPEQQLELTVDQELSLPPEAKAGNPERCGKSYKIINCTLGNTRSRGILVKADDGVIQDCFITGCGMSAVSIGPEYYWNESDYSWNVTVVGNHFRHNGLRNNRYADGVVFIHGDGAVGNKNIKIIHNKFEENYCPYMMRIEWVDGVTIADNVIDHPSPLPLSDPGFIVSLHHARNITLKGNTYRNVGTSVLRTVETGEDVQGVSGI